jgi:hypothetical protein
MIKKLHCSYGPDFTVQIALNVPKVVSVSFESQAEPEMLPL